MKRSSLSALVVLYFSRTELDAHRLYPGGVKFANLIATVARSLPADCGERRAVQAVREALKPAKPVYRYDWL